MIGLVCFSFTVKLEVRLKSDEDVEMRSVGFLF